MAAADFLTLVAEAGFEWVPLENWNVYRGRQMRWPTAERPNWRERPPWNKPDPPRILLRPANFEALELCESIKKAADNAATQASIVEVPLKTTRFICPAHDDSALYRNFTRSEATPDAIRLFANRYGLLWPTSIGVPFAEWEYEISTMRFLVNMWEAIVEKNTVFFADILKKTQRGVRFHHEDLLGYRVYGSGESRLKLSAAFADKGTIFEIAREVLVTAINIRLSELGAFPQLVTKVLEAKHKSTTVSVLSARPNNLLGAMWLQFAEAISGHTQYRQCEVCQKYFQLEPGVNRADRCYCSNACRNKALRRRKKLSREMRSRGSSLREIAKATNSEVERIKEWLR